MIQIWDIHIYKLGAENEHWNIISVDISSLGIKR